KSRQSCSEWWSRPLVSSPQREQGTWPPYSRPVGAVKAGEASAGRRRHAVSARASPTIAASAPAQSGESLRRPARWTVRTAVESSPSARRTRSLARFGRRACAARSTSFRACFMSRPMAGGMRCPLHAWRSRLGARLAEQRAPQARGVEAERLAQVEEREGRLGIAAEEPAQRRLPRAPLPRSARAHQAADGIDQHGGAQRALAGDALGRPVVDVLAVRRPCRSALVSHGPHRTAGSKFRAALRMWIRTGGARATGGGAWLISTRSGSPEPPTPTVPLPKRGRARFATESGRPDP